MNTEAKNADTSSENPARPAALDDLVLAFFERAEAEGLVALLALCVEHPALAHDLRRRIETLIAFDMIDLVLPDEPPRDA